MAQIYKIFVNEIPIQIKEGNPGDVVEGNDAVHPVFFFTDQEKIRKAFHLVETGNYYRSLTIIGEDARQIRNSLFKAYRLIKAAGGLVYNAKQEVLLIHRHGLWDLPKGKLEPDELPKDAAVREVMEETGVEGIILREKIINTYHTYLTGKQKVLKKTYWYMMEAEGKDELQPQLEEGIDLAIWTSGESLHAKMQHTYGSVKDVIDRGLIYLHQL